jgi:hypothetical protein
MFRKLVIGVLLLASTASADDKIVGHMTPLPDELLQQPITLSCGVTIREWRGGIQPSAGNIKFLNALCDKAMASFKPFLATRGLQAPRSGQLVWNWSLMPDGLCGGTSTEATCCYRCMNDIRYRFANRFVRYEVWGYTGYNQQYSFTVSRSPILNKIFTHEMFHAMSMYYGLYDSHPGSWDDQTQADEVLAQAFTRYMGYR